MKKEDFEAWKAEMDMALAHDMVIPRPINMKLGMVFSACAQQMRKSRVPNKIRDKLNRYYLILLARRRMLHDYIYTDRGSITW